MGLGFGGIQERGAAMLAQGNDNGMTESQETSPNGNGENMWGFLLWGGSGARLPCMFGQPQLKFLSQKQHYHDTCLLNTS